MQAAFILFLEINSLYSAMFEGHRGSVECRKHLTFIFILVAQKMYNFFKRKLVNRKARKTLNTCKLLRGATEMNS